MDEFVIWFDIVKASARGIHTTAPAQQVSECITVISRNYQF